MRIINPIHNNSNKINYSQLNNNNNSSSNTNLTITIRTDKSKYYNDEDITILGNVYDNNLKLTNTILSVTPIFHETPFLPSFLSFLSFLSSSHETKQPLILQKTEIPVIDGIYNFTLYLSQQGLYNISISDKSGNNERFLLFEAKNKFFSYTFLLIYLIIFLIFLYCLFTWIAIRGKTSSKNLLYRFYMWLKQKPQEDPTTPSKGQTQPQSEKEQILPSKNSSSDENKDEEFVLFQIEAEFVLLKV